MSSIILGLPLIGKSKCKFCAGLWSTTVRGCSGVSCDILEYTTFVSRTANRLSMNGLCGLDERSMALLCAPNCLTRVIGR
jgi:hypothetical protein